jgi:hypothetical protein
MKFTALADRVELTCYVNIRKEVILQQVRMICSS